MLRTYADRIPSRKRTNVTLRSYCTKVAEPPFDGSIEYVDPTTVGVHKVARYD